MKKKAVVIMCLILAIASVFAACEFGDKAKKIVVSGIEGYADAVIDEAKKEISIITPTNILAVNISAIKVDSDILIKAYTDEQRKQEVVSKLEIKEGENIFYITLSLKSKPKVFDNWIFKITRTKAPLAASAELILFKSEYLLNDDFTNDAEGTYGKINLTFKDGSSKIVPITKAMLSGFDTSSIGRKQVIIKYSDEYSFTRTIFVKEFSSANFTMPTKTTIDIDGLLTLTSSIDVFLNRNITSGTVYENLLFHDKEENKDSKSYQQTLELCQKAGITLDELKSVKDNLTSVLFNVFDIGQKIQDINNKFSPDDLNVTQINAIFKDIDEIFTKISPTKIGVLLTYVNNFTDTVDYYDKGIALATEKNLTGALNKFSEYKAISVANKIPLSKFVDGANSARNFQVKLQDFYRGDNVNTFISGLKKIAKCNSYNDFTNIPKQEIMDMVKSLSSMVNVFAADNINLVKLIKNNLINDKWLQTVFNFNKMFDNSHAICNLLDIITYDNITTIVDNVIKNKENSHVYFIVAEVAKILKTFDGKYSVQERLELQNLLDVILDASNITDYTALKIYDFALKISTWGESEKWTTAQKDEITDFIAGLESNSSINVDLKQSSAFAFVPLNSTITSLSTIINNNFDFTYSCRQNQQVFLVEDSNIFNYNSSLLGEQTILIKYEDTQVKVKIFVYDNTNNNLFIPKEDSFIAYDINHVEEKYIYINDSKQTNNTFEVHLHSVSATSFLSNYSFVSNKNLPTTIEGVDFAVNGVQQGFLKITHDVLGDIYLLQDFYVLGNTPLITKISIEDAFFSQNSPYTFNSLLMAESIDKNNPIPGVLLVEYDYGRSSNYVTLNSSMITGFDDTAKGMQTVTITYEGLTTTIFVDVVRIEDIINNAKIINVTMPSKFIQNDPLNTMLIELELKGEYITRSIGYSEFPSFDNSLKISYSNLQMICENNIGFTGFDEKTLGKQTITFNIYNISYQKEVEVLSETDAKKITSASIAVENEYNKAIIKEGSNISDYIYVTLEFGNGVFKETMTLAQANEMLTSMKYEQLTIVDNNFTLGNCLVQVTSKDAPFNMTANFEYVSLEDANKFLINEVRSTTTTEREHFYVYDNTSKSKINMYVDVIYESYYGEVRSRATRVPIMEFINRPDVQEKNIDFTKSGYYDHFTLDCQNTSGKIKTLYIYSFAVLKESEIETITDIYVNQAKEIYAKGEEFAGDSFVLGVNYGYGYSRTMLPYDENTMTIEDFNNQVAGNQTIKINYLGFSTTFDITIITTEESQIVTEIELKRPLNHKKTYLVGETFDKNNFAVSLTYGNGYKTQDVNNILMCEIEGFNSAITGEQIVKIKCGTAELNFTVRVISQAETTQITNIIGIDGACKILPQNATIDNLVLYAQVEYGYGYNRDSVKLTSENTSINESTSSPFVGELIISFGKVTKTFEINFKYIGYFNFTIKSIKYENCSLTDVIIDKLQPTTITLSCQSYYSTLDILLDATCLDTTDKNNPTFNVFGNKVSISNAVVYSITSITKVSAIEGDSVDGSFYQNMKLEYFYVDAYCGNSSVTDHPTIKLKLPISAITNLDFTTCGTKNITISLLNQTFESSITVNPLGTIKNIDAEYKNSSSNYFIKGAPPQTIKVTIDLVGNNEKYSWITLPFLAIREFDINKEGEQTVSVDIYGNIYNNIKITVYSVQQINSLNVEYSCNQKYGNFFFVNKNKCNITATCLLKGIERQFTMPLDLVNITNLDLSKSGAQTVSINILGTVLPFETYVLADGVYKITSYEILYVNEPEPVDINCVDVENGKFIRKIRTIQYKDISGLDLTTAGTQQLTVTIDGCALSCPIDIYGYESIDNIYGKTSCANEQVIEAVLTLNCNYEYYSVDFNMRCGEKTISRSVTCPSSQINIDCSSIGVKSGTITYQNKPYNYQITVYDYGTVRNIIALNANYDEIFAIQNTPLNNIKFFKINCNLVFDSTTTGSYFIVTANNVKGLDLTKAEQQSVTITLFGQELISTISVCKIDAIEGLRLYVNGYDTNFHQYMDINEINLIQVYCKVSCAGVTTHTNLNIQITDIKGLDLTKAEQQSVTITLFGKDLPFTIVVLA